MRPAPSAWTQLIQRQALPLLSGRHRRSRKADDNRHDALFDYARRLQLDGVDEDTLQTAVETANNEGFLHPDFATKGPCPARDVRGMVEYVLRKVKSDTRTNIELRVGELHKQAVEAERLLAATGRVYRQGNERLVYCGYEQADSSKGRKTSVARVRPYDVAWLTCELSEVARCFKLKVDEISRTVERVAVEVRASSSRRCCRAPTSNSRN